VSIDDASFLSLSMNDIVDAQATDDDPYAGLTSSDVAPGTT
jgi:hypothetical protein